MPSTLRIGIDLGTTNSLVAVFESDGPRLIPNAHGAFLTPSVVGMLESGEIVVGEGARELALTAPERVVSSFKGWMGTDRAIEFAGKTYSATELSSIVLGALIRDVEAELGEAPTDVVITVPAYFNQHQRAATMQAAELAGLNVERIVNEPTAAALTYGFHRRDEDCRLVVFDLGGGTFDVTVMEIFDGTLEILGTAGESHLGGENFTEALVGHALRATGRSLEMAEMKEPLLVARLRSEAERAKRSIGTDEVGRIRMADSDGIVPPDPMIIEVGAAEFEELVAPLLARLRRPTLRALRDSSLTPGQIDQVLLVGGATRMPVIRRLATEIFARSPRADVHPDEAVALGASIQSALVADDAAVDDIVLTDVCPHTLGVEIVKELGSRTVDGYFMPVVHRNTTIPVSREKSVYTVHDGQTRLGLQIFQGESRRIDDNLLLGELTITGLPPGPSGVEVILRFTYDLNGLLEVEAIVPSTGKRHTVVIKLAVSTLSDAEIEKAVERMQALKFYPRENQGNQRLLAFASAALKEVDPRRRDDLEGAVDRYEAWFQDNDLEQFDAARQALIMTLSAVGLPYAGDDA